MLIIRSQPNFQKSVRLSKTKLFCIHFYRFTGAKVAQLGYKKYQIKYFSIQKLYIFRFKFKKPHKSLILIPKQLSIKNFSHFSKSSKTFHQKKSQQALSTWWNKKSTANTKKKKKERTPNPIKFKKKNSEIVSDITDKSTSE